MTKQKKVNISDYKEYPFDIPDIFLDFSIHHSHIDVISSMQIIPKSIPSKELVLEGIDIELQKILINDSVISSEIYDLDNKKIIIKSVPNEKFVLKIVSQINPYSNTSLEGLYSSSNVLTTQCEAEGFRRICFHPDRPDVLSCYQVRIEADINQYPVLLSNGNKISSSIIPSNPSRHEVVWQDPFRKPSYLFALVAGDLKKVESRYISSSNRVISINIFVEKGDEVYTEHAINSLKKAMKWDEDVYGLEYDLDLYNIVAIRHFNMGAMENKGLNIFNSKLILADSEITTDDELERIESVIAHEYFHNWTGNRITCRDWFQLSLKEGLTVFRDQSFTSDLHSEPLKRIEDVSLLRNIQFKEDAGPTSHPVKPNEYLAIDNFYTTTIYEKGAELIRMLYILLGKSYFTEGFKRYIQDFDGSAATTEDFVYSLIRGAKESGADLKFDVEQFLFWYYQSGTPIVNIKREWNHETGKLSLIINQSFNSIAKHNNKKILVIPIKLSLILDNESSESKLLILDKEEIKFDFDITSNQKKPPVLSLFRDFSAPVTWCSDLTVNELLFLIDNDNDFFSIWDSVQSLFRKVILSRSTNSPDMELEESLIGILERNIGKFRENNKSFLACILTFPSVSELELYQNTITPISLYRSYQSFSEKFSQSLSSNLFELLEDCLKTSTYTWPDGQGARKLIGVIWRLLMYTEDVAIRDQILKSVSGNSMTLSKSALTSLVPFDCPERELAVNTFFSRWENNPVVLDTWFGIQSCIPRNNSLEVINSLFEHPLFDPISPNTIRSILGGFSKNTEYFHSQDGSGYLFMAKQIISFDNRNPITASRLAKVFSRWKCYEEPNSSQMLKAITMMDNHILSSNTREVIELILNNNNV